ncbi:MAG: PIN domain-containing protein [Synergistaceae bacterium]|jgi:predicted nucleic acid-binding protein|nr:PIN domain-containing protein [Synergistaceae bacterium]
MQSALQIKDEAYADMKIYLDNCCLNRPFDDLNYDIVRIESEAVVAIIDKCENEDWNFFSSDVLFDEISRLTDFVKKQKIMLLYRSATLHVEFTEEIILRGKELEQFGIESYDALHIASAESGGADVFLTTDNRLIKSANRANVNVLVKNPLIWLMEVLV